MSVIQQSQDEIRYLKRRNLVEESRIIDGWQRDLIRQYGIDCIYHKMKMDSFTDFKKIIDSNTILKRAYGYDITPDYQPSVQVIALPEVDNDIFQLQKFGYVQNQDITLYFDSTDFACSMAPVVGRYREYEIDKTEINCELPDFDAQNGQWPLELDLGGNDSYRCGVLSGNFRVVLSGYTLNKEETVVCDPYEHTDFNIEFPQNEDLYYSLKHKIANDDYLETMLFLTYTVKKTPVGVEPLELPVLTSDVSGLYCSIRNISCMYEYERMIPEVKLKKIDFSKVKTQKRVMSILCQMADTISVPYELIKGSVDPDKLITDIYDRLAQLTKSGLKVFKPVYRNILHGTLHGNVLFFDLAQIGKYTNTIHPEPGDIVEIDFPDDKNREKYEITESVDRQLTTDGLNPLLHKYVWRCKARRYVNSYEELAPDDTEADARIEEKHDYDAVVQEEVSKEVSFYPDQEDAVYGGYDGVLEKYDKQEIDPNRHYKLDYIDDGSAIDILRFGCGSRLVTTGYELVFVTAGGDAYQLTTSELESPYRDAVIEQNLKYLKATDSQIVFVNILGESQKLCEDETVTDKQLEISLNSLYDKTTDTGRAINANGDSFYKFKDTRTIIFATQDHLYCRLASNNSTCRLI